MIRLAKVNVALVVSAAALFTTALAPNISHAAGVSSDQAATSSNGCQTHTVQAVVRDNGVVVPNAYRAITLTTCPTIVPDRAGSWQGWVSLPCTNNQGANGSMNTTGTGSGTITFTWWDNNQSKYLSADVNGSWTGPSTESAHANGYVFGYYTRIDFYSTVSLSSYTGGCA